MIRSLRHPAAFLLALALGCAAVASGATAQGAPDDAARRLALAGELLQRTGAMRSSAAMMDQMMRLQADAYRRANPERGDDAARFVEELLAPAFRERLGELEEVFVNLWAANFDVAELEEINAFYRSPLGQKLIQRSPALTQQAMNLGAAWGQRIERELQERLRPELARRRLQAPI